VNAKRQNGLRLPKLHHSRCHTPAYPASSENLDHL
jgi:hypothetical protein